ncbi:hypothetical protein MFLO_14357 [Listeria floridensis FSL S10-1187]|uniref:Uncharacterized protein n=1 Tax=Listeria floridensis FSL S10-1187 TaxID=1265817 RepID=A0ABP3AUG4_9LIST|nr:hypothetical protein [Listeria floridensis]EUJ26144.1 hypothetical protein MFLO_14357 [Listeria floridensis FSL S10-1187]
MKAIWVRIRTQTFSLILASQTLLFGVFLLAHQDFMATKTVYQPLTDLMDDQVIASIMAGIGFLNILCLLTGKNRVRRWVVIAMAFMWALFFAAFFSQELGGHPNSGWIFILGLNTAILYEAATEDFR